MYKKNLIKVSLLIALVSALSARENPFVPTQTYIEEKESLVDPGEIIEPYNPNDKGRTIKIMPEEEIKPIEKIEPIVEEIKPIEKIEEIVFKEVIEDNNTSCVTAAPKEIKIYKYNLIDFVNIDITEDIMNIQTKYKLKKQFVLEDEKKMVFDFTSKKSFYTKRETLSTHKDFKKITIGAHPENKYFRVVIQVPDNLIEYETHVDENGSITISKK